MEPGRRRQQRSSARGRDGSLLDRPWPPWARRAEGATAQVGAEQDCLAHWVDQVTFSVALGKRIEAKVHCAFKKQRHRIMVRRLLLHLAAAAFYSTSWPSPSPQPPTSQPRPPEPHPCHLLSRRHPKGAGGSR
ncbi:unnamed protein product [Urochloa humidicola]